MCNLFELLGFSCDYCGWCRYQVPFVCPSKSKQDEKVVQSISALILTIQLFYYTLQLISKSHVSDCAAKRKRCICHRHGRLWPCPLRHDGSQIGTRWHLQGSHINYLLQFRRVFPITVCHETNHSIPNYINKVHRKHTE